jgi:transcriptional regulator with XRE-family HTH domain
MARAALDWSLVQLAEAAGVDRKTILRFEQGVTTPRDVNLGAIRTAFETAGVTFADRGGVFPPA